MKTSEYLIANGWKECPDPFSKDCRSFFKRFSTPTPCHLNNNKEGMQICIKVFDWKDYPQFKPNGESYQIDLQGELEDETWIKFEQWGTPNNIEDGLKLIPRMLALWELAAKPANKE